MLSDVWDRGWTTFACRENVIPLPCCFKTSDNAQRVAGSTGLIQDIRSPFGLLHYPVTCWYFRSSGLLSLIWVSVPRFSWMWGNKMQAFNVFISISKILSPSSVLDFTPPTSTSYTRCHWPHAPTGSVFRTVKETHHLGLWGCVSKYDMMPGPLRFL